MDDKRYTDGQARTLLRAVIAAIAAPPTRARAAMIHLLEARLGDVVAARSALEAAHASTDEDVVSWQHSAEDRLRTASDLRRLAIGGPVFRIRDVTLDVSPTDARVEVSASLSRLLKIQETLLLRQVGRALGACDCGRLLVREGKREFCSPRCQKRVYMRRFRSSAKNARKK